MSKSISKSTPEPTMIIRTKEENLIYLSTLVNTSSESEKRKIIIEADGKRHPFKSMEQIMEWHKKYNSIKIYYYKDIAPSEITNPKENYL